MTKYLIFIFFIVGHSAIGQNINPTKSQLLQVLKKSVRQDSKGKVLVISNPWVACNRDSSFYKSDTLKLYNNVNYHYPNCCDFIELTFYKKNAFIIVRTQTCKEPATASAIKNSDWFTMNILKSKSALIIETINQGKVVDRFKVVSIHKTTNTGELNDITEVLTLVRQHRPQSK